MESMLTTEYDGCGKCLVGVRRLSRVTDSTNSPEKQLHQVVAAVDSVGGHIIAWADDWEVSGATNPFDREGLGPWLRGEMGPYSGIAGAAVDRIGRNQRDVLNTGWQIKEDGKLLVTYGHIGPWDLDDQTDEMRFSMEALGAQLELRAIQRRNREAAVEMRAAGRPRQKNSYGYKYVRLVPTGKVDHVAIDEVAAEILRTVAERILTDETGQITCSTECARLTRAAVPSPADHRAMMYGRAPKGHKWNAKNLREILTSEAALGYLMHNGRPVLDQNGNPVRLAPPLWDRATRTALIEKTTPKRKQSGRAPKSTHLLIGCSWCGTCGQRLYTHSHRPGRKGYMCKGRAYGLPVSSACIPAPVVTISTLDRMVEEWFLGQYGRVPLYRREYDPGTGYAAQIKELEADRQRLYEDRQAGLFDAAEDLARYRRDYLRLGKEITTLRALPDRPAGMYWKMTGKTVADAWHEASDDVARRELLAQYEVRVVLFPTGAKRRVWIHGLDPDTESQARQEAAERDEVDKEARYALREMGADVADRQPTEADAAVSEAEAREEAWRCAQDERDAGFFAQLQARDEAEPDNESSDEQAEAEADGIAPAA